MKKIEIDKKLLKDISDFCKINGIDDVQGKVNSMLRKELMLLKYGNSPFNNTQEIVEDKVEEKPIVEKQKEEKPKRKQEKKKIEEISQQTEIKFDEVEDKKEEIKQEEPKITRRVVKITKKN